jgi:hypothetical protein
MCVQFFAYGQNGPWFASTTMQTMPPRGWQLVTAKPKEPEKVFNFGPGGPPWSPPPGTLWQLVEDKKPAEKKEEKKEKHPVDKKVDDKDKKLAEKEEKHPVGDHTTPLIILFI